MCWTRPRSRIYCSSSSSSEITSDPVQLQKDSLLVMALKMDGYIITKSGHVISFGLIQNLVLWNYSVDHQGFPIVRSNPNRRGIICYVCGKAGHVLFVERQVMMITHFCLYVLLELCAEHDSGRIQHGHDRGVGRQLTICTLSARVPGRTSTQTTAPAVVKVLQTFQPWLCNWRKTVSVHLPHNFFSFRANIRTYVGNCSLTFEQRFRAAAVLCVVFDGFENDICNP